ncbi:MAG: lipocalin-like domain-containing protein [Pseudomonadota bacterium]
MVLSIAWLQTAFAQGFAGLGRDEEGFLPVLPGKEFSFPTDHGPHDGHRIEWWYLTANLQDVETNEAIGVQWTLFRSGLGPPSDNLSEETTAGQVSIWSADYLFMAHAAVTTSKGHYSAEKFARDGVGQAGVSAAPFSAYIDDWVFEAREGADLLSDTRLRAYGQDFGYDLTLAANGPLVLQGEEGFSIKSPEGQASYYYSQPFFSVRGEVEIDGVVRQVKGRAWMDREWSSKLLAETQSGWDWFSLHFEDGQKAMLFRLRDRVNGDFFAGTWIAADGKSTSLKASQISIDPLRTKSVEGRKVPLDWRVAIDGRGVDLRTKPLNDNSWMATSFPYWEGPIRFEGSHAGVGYLEMTGY